MSQTTWQNKFPKEAPFSRTCILLQLEGNQAEDSAEAQKHLPSQEHPVASS